MKTFKYNIKKTNKSFYFFNFFIIQTFDNLGSFSNLPFISTPIQRELSTKDKFFRPDNTSIESWFDNDHLIVSGLTSSRLEELKSYDVLLPYIVNFDIESVNYINYNGLLINGVSRITKLDDDIVYVFDANNDPSIGTSNQTTGLRYIDNDFETKFYFTSEDYNLTNSILEANFKEEYLIGVVDKLETKNDIFIDRGNINVNERILKMSDINNLSQLENYGNGFYNLKIE